jgi:integrase/recombinase XerD
MRDSSQLPLFEELQDGLTERTHLINSVKPFLEYLRGEGKTQNTLTSFRSDMNLVCQFLGDERPLGKIMTPHLEEFLHWLEFGRGIPCSRKSYARRVTTLKVYFKWLKETKIRKDDPAVKIVQRSGPAPLQPVLSDPEISILLDEANRMRAGKKPDSRPYILLRLLLETGIKKSEASRLVVDDVENRDSESPTLLVKHKRQNVYKDRRLPIPPEWVGALDEYLEQYEPKDDQIFDCTPRNLEYVLTDLAKAAGVETRVSFETLRWTSAVLDYRQGMDMDDLREKMGLSEISWRETSQKIIKLADIQVQASKI